MKRLLTNIRMITIITIFSSFLLPTSISIAQNDFSIIPELTQEEITDANTKIRDIGKSGGQVMNNYRLTAGKLSTAQQLATGIMNRDTIMNYLVFVIQFLSQLGLLVGAVFIMYAGYKYMVSVFESGKTPTTTIKNAIIGVLIITFSYAIMRILTSIIGLT